MIINTNVNALRSLNSLKNNALGESMSSQRLSTGLRINSAADDAAGLAISRKMSAQIRGLNMAGRNSRDGDSMLKTADGDLAEMTNMIHRMRELTIQAGNDTYMDSDREKMQLEIDQLRLEINSLSKRSQFNTKPLLDTTTHANPGFVPPLPEVTDPVAAQIEVVELALEKYLEDYARDPKNNWASLLSDFESEFGGDKHSALIVADIEQYWNNMEPSVADLKDEHNRIVQLYIDLVNNNPLLKLPMPPNDVPDFNKTAMGLGSHFTSNSYGYPNHMNEGYNTAKNHLPTNTSSAYDAVVGTYSMLGCATHAVAHSKASIDALLAQLKNVDLGNLSDVPPTIELPTKYMLQVGANAGQLMTTALPEKVNTTTLGIDFVSVLTRTEAVDYSLERLDNALSFVTSLRGELGAQMNRIEFIEQSLSVTEENLSASLSRIEDVDMAKAISMYAKYQVLSSAATSMLAQSNQEPQRVMQLLQN